MVIKASIRCRPKHTPAYTVLVTCEHNSEVNEFIADRMDSGKYESCEVLVIQYQDD